MGISSIAKRAQESLLLLSVVLYFYAPENYSLQYCGYCFAVFVASATLLLFNNVRVYGTLFIFEVLFTFSFFFTNFVYPVFIYESDPYFSLFTRTFNEHVMSKCTALAMFGFVSFSVGAIKVGKAPIPLNFHKRYVLSPLNGIDIIILFVLFVLFLYSSIDALRAGYSQATSVGGGFFYIFSLFYIYKYFAHSIGKSTKLFVYCFFGLIGLYVVLNFMLGNRGEPLYLGLAILYCYHRYVNKIANFKIILVAVIGLFIFYFVGVTRISLNQMGLTSRSEKIDNWKAEDNLLRYANELIINNRSSFVLVDHADKNGYSYGKTWSVNFFSIIPFGQSFALKVLEIPKQDFSTTHLTTYLEFGKDDPDAFGLGTNLIGDIYLCFGAIGVLVFMFLFGWVIRTVHDRSIASYSYYQMFYIILIALSVYYTRATLFCILQMLAWTYVLGVLNSKNSKKVMQISK